MHNQSFTRQVTQFAVTDQNSLGYTYYGTSETCKALCDAEPNCYSVEYYFATGSSHACEMQSVNIFTPEFDIDTWREYSTYDHYFKCGKYPSIIPGNNLSVHNIAEKKSLKMTVRFLWTLN